MAEELHYNDAGTHVLVYHPDLDARWECPPDYLPVARARGWELAEPEVEEPEVEAAAPAPKKSRKSPTTPGE